MTMGTGSGKQPDPRTLGLFEAFSDADERYVAEMLSDDVAESIRAANKRSHIRITRSIGAIAAVFAIVVGIGVIPHGSSKASCGGSAKNADNYIAADNAKSDEAAADEKPEQKGKDVTYGIKREKADQEMTNEAEAVQDNTNGDDAPSEPVLGITGKSDYDGTASPEAENDKAGEKADEGDVLSGKCIDGILRLDDGSEYYFGEKISAYNCEDTVYAEGSGFRAYPMTGFDTKAMLAVEYEGVRYAALSSSESYDTLEELYYALDFPDMLRCEGIVTQNGIEEISEAEFEAMKTKVFSRRSDYKLTDGHRQKDDPVTYLCSLGVHEESFISTVYITVSSNGIVEVSALGLNCQFALE